MSRDRYNNHQFSTGMKNMNFTFHTMLRGSPVTMAWKVLRLQMEEMVSRYGG
jgi:hypothetical protein